MTKRSDARAGGGGRATPAGNDFGTRLGGMIRTLRRRAKLTQAELALKAGIDRNYLRAIEGGEANPSLQVLTALAKALKLEILVSPPPDPRPIDPVSFQAALERTKRGPERRPRPT